MFIIFSITYLSNTPHLMVSQTDSWFNEMQFENVSITDVFKEGSLFYEPWEDTRGLEFYLHKLGHFVFYGMLSVFLFWRSSNFKTIFLKLMLITGFAFADEIHQYFVVGRSGRIMDVGFDMFSVLLFLFFVIVSGKIKREANNKITTELSNKKKTA